MIFPRQTNQEGDAKDIAFILTLYPFVVQQVTLRILFIIFQQHGTCLIVYSSHFIQFLRPLPTVYQRINAVRQTYIWMRKWNNMQSSSLRIDIGCVFHV